MTKLKAPLSYQGGKQRVGKKIAEIINPNRENKPFLDLCCGSGAVSIAMMNHGVRKHNIYMLDASDWGQFWNQIGNGTFDLDYFEYLVGQIPEDRDFIKSHLEKLCKEGLDESNFDDVPLWLILQAGSFGGKHIWKDWDNMEWKNASFRSFWKPTPTSSRRSPVNPMMPMPSTLLGNIKTVAKEMVGVKGYWQDLSGFSLEGWIDSLPGGEDFDVFIDPPYNNTQGYGYSVEYIDFLKNAAPTVKRNGGRMWVTDYVQHGDLYWELGITKKGGISGGSKERQEILSQL